MTIIIDVIGAVDFKFIGVRARGLGATAPLTRAKSLFSGKS